MKSVTDSGGLDALIAVAEAEGELNIIAPTRDWCNYGEMMDNFSRNRASIARYSFP